MPTPEDKARENIDHLLTLAGWAVRDQSAANILAYRGVAIRNFTLKAGHGFADYLLYVDGRAAGVIEAKKEGVTLTGVETQSERYTKGLPDGLPAWNSPLPFSYESTGIENRFTNGLDPEPRSHPVFSFHKPEALIQWLEIGPHLQAADPPADYGKRTGTFLSRMQQMPPLIDDLWPPKPHKYSQADQNELSFFHYLKIPYPDRAAGTWNNLGVQFDHCDLPSKSVGAYRKAEELGETLAMSNLAQKLIKAGFLKEADEICNRAIKVSDYHKNVGQAIARIKAIPDEEESKENNILGKVKPISEFYRDYGSAAAKIEIDEHVSRWRGPDCELLVTIRGRTFLAEGDYEVPRSGTLRFAMLELGPLGKPPETDRYHVKYSGDIFGHAINCNVSRHDVAEMAPMTLLGQMANQKKALMIASDTLREIRVYEKDSAEKAKFYQLTRLD